MSDTSWAWVAVILLLASIVIMWVQAHFIEEMQSKAVEHGAAEWVIHKDGTTTFHWKGEAEAKP